MTEPGQLSQACQRCWRRKQKCDRQNPCTTCRRVGMTCVPRTHGRPIGSPNGGTEVGEPFTGSFVDYMTQRIAFLESQLDSSTETNLPTLTSPLAGPHSPIAAREHGNTASDTHSPRPSSIDNAVNEVQYLSLTAMSAPERQDLAIWESPGFATFVKEVSTLSGMNPGISASDDKSSEKDMASALANFDSILDVTGDIPVESLINVYCLASTIDFPCISTSLCMETLDTVKQATKDNTKVQLAQILPEKFIVTSVPIAIGTLLLPSTSQTKAIRSKSIDVSKALLPIVAAKDSDNTVVQCLTLHAVLSLYQPSAAPTWYLLGLAMTKAISTGMHRQIPSPAEDGEELLPTLPLFWTLYTLDRAISFTMDRPLSIEDEDISLDIPELPAQPLVSNRNAALAPLQIWTIHHAQLLARWRRDLDVDLDVALSSFQYWRDTCRAMVDRVTVSMKVQDTATSVDGNEASVMAYVRKHEAQLACRALVQLCVITSKRKSMAGPLEKCRGLVMVEVPQFITSLKDCTEARRMSLTFLDAYDIFAAAVIYIYCQQLPDRSSFEVLGDASNMAFGIGVAGMKMVMSVMEVLQGVADVFVPVQGLKEVLWGFLSALERSKTDRRAAHHDIGSSLAGSEASQMLAHEISRCSVPVPGHLVKLMEACLHSRDSNFS